MATAAVVSGRDSREGRRALPAGQPQAWRQAPAATSEGLSSAEACCCLWSLVHALSGAVTWAWSFVLCDETQTFNSLRPVEPRNKSLYLFMHA